MNVAFAARNRAQIASGLVLALAASALVAVAVSQRGNPARETHLNDASVWISTNETHGTNGTPAMFGQMNVPAKQFASTLVPTGDSPELDLIQHGNAVVGIDTGAGTMIPVNTTAQKLGTDPVKLGRGTAQMGGDDERGTLAVVSEKGYLFASLFNPDDPLADLTAVDAESAKKISTVGKDAAVAVAQDGRIFAVSNSKGLTTATFANDGWKSSTTDLPSAAKGTLTVTAVGLRPVVMSSVAGSDRVALIMPDGTSVTVEAPGGQAQLQQAGPDADSVVVATSQSLVRVGITDGKVTRLITDAAGTPAAPVVFQGCAFGAWSGASPTEARACPSGAAASKPLDSPAQASVNDLVFRVNHQQLLLNDRASGIAWEIVDGDPVQVTDWNSARPQKATKSNASEQASNNNVKAPEAVPDKLGARPGRITALYVLDNDKTTPGTVLSVHSVSPASNPAVDVSIAPDQQTVLVDVPASASGSTFSFTYDAENGSSKPSKEAEVSVTVVPNGTYAQPSERKGYEPRSWAVPANGSVTIPVLNNWRVYGTGDLPSLDALVPQSVEDKGASAIATSDGSILYTAGNKATTDTIHFAVVDGDKVAKSSLTIRVQGRDDAGVRPEAADDFVKVVVDKSRTFSPLANDSPGSDPKTPDAQLKLAGAIKSPSSGLAVSPPSRDGKVTFKATRPGPYTLKYQATYGNAPPSKPAVIRVQAVEASGQDRVVGGPDAVTTRGTEATLLDPLINDSSPSGDLLTVTGVDVPELANLQVAVVKGRWLRVNQRQAVDQAQIEAFTYTVTDGATSATTQVTVSELPTLPNAQPVPGVDRGSVRVGDSLLIAPLDNDVDPSGSGLTLASDQQGADPRGDRLPSGRLTVAAAGVQTQDLGAAYLAGNLVRYVPPSKPTRKDQYQVRISYVVQNAVGGRTSGLILVNVWPAGSVKTDLAPAPVDLEARVVAGGSVVIHVPTSGVDPDGDSVQVQGLALAGRGDPQPTHGAIVAQTANSLTYQAFPTADNSGTDEFTYQVGDTFGLLGRATIRVAVVQPTVLPPPVAHNVTLTAAPGDQLNLKVVSPRFVDYPEGAEPTLLDPQKVPGAKSPAHLVDGQPGWLAVDLPDKIPPTGSTTVDYQVQGDLGPPSPASISFELVPGYHAPPIAIDKFAEPTSKATSVAVPLIKGDYSPTGSKLSVRPMKGLDQATNVLTVALTDRPQVIPFVIHDEENAEASAVVYVPARGARALPYWNKKTIKVGKDASTTIKLADYVTDPEGAKLTLTTQDRVWAAPGQGLEARTAGASAIKLTGTDGYQGPASLVFAVSRNGTLNDFTLITIPVLVGKPTPVLRCPTDVIDVQQGLVGGAPFSPLSQCHVWTPPGVDRSGLTFHLAWKKKPSQLSISVNDRAQVFVRAGSDAKPGDEGSLQVTVNGYKSVASTMRIRVVKAPPLQVSPINIAGVLSNGKPTVIHLNKAVSSPFGFEKVSIVDVGSIKGAQVTHDKHDITVKITTKELHGTFKISYLVTDLTDLKDTSRQRRGVVTLQVIGVPDPPTAVTPRPGFLPNRVPLSWVAPNMNGADLLDYKVEFRGGGRTGTQICTKVPCDILGLTNGKDYVFRVAARNRITKEYGDFSAPWSAAGTPDTPPLQPTGLVVSERKDKSVRLTWASRKSGNADASTVGWAYTITAKDTGLAPIVIRDPNATTTLVPTTTNETPTTFTIMASNRAGDSGVAEITDQSAWTPQTPTFVGTVTPSKTAAGEASVRLTWTPVSHNGAAHPVSQYVLTRTDDDGSSNLVTVCETSATSCDDTGLKSGGQHYRYSIMARNQYYDSQKSTVRVQISTQPEQMAAPTVDAVKATDANGTATLRYTTVESNGSGYQVNCRYTTNGSAPTTSSTVCPGSPWQHAGPGENGVRALTGLPQRATVRFAVWENNAAENAAFANGPISAPSNAVLTNAPPTAPSNPGCPARSGTTVNFSWSAGSTTNGRSIHYEWTGAFSGSTSGTTASHSFPEDGANRTITVVSVDSAGGRSGGLNVTCQDAPVPQPTEWVVTVTSGTCPEDTFASGSTHFHAGPPVSCSAPGGFIKTNTQLTVTCWVDKPGWDDNTMPTPRPIRWLRIKSGGPGSGWYVYSAHTNSYPNPSGMPGC